MENFVSFSDDDQAFIDMAINDGITSSKTSNFVEFSDDDDVFLNMTLIYSVRGLNWKPPKDFVPNFSFAIPWIYEDSNKESDENSRFSHIANESEVNARFYDRIVVYHLVVLLIFLHFNTLT